jgi:hypothetical protein
MSFATRDIKETEINIKPGIIIAIAIEPEN